MKAAVFLERDGILNLAATQNGRQVTPSTADEFKVNPEALDTLEELQAQGFLLIATTNQPRISRGTLSRRELDIMHMILRRNLPIDDLFLCPHDEADRCPCRKPKPGLITEAAFKYHIDLDRSFVISDKWQDAEAARFAGCTSILIDSPWIGKVHHDFVVPDLAAAVQKIAQLDSFSKNSFLNPARALVAG